MHKYSSFSKVSNNSYHNSWISTFNLLINKKHNMIQIPVYSVSAAIKLLFTLKLNENLLPDATEK